MPQFPQGKKLGSGKENFILQNPPKQTGVFEKNLKKIIVIMMMFVSRPFNFLFVFQVERGKSGGGRKRRRSNTLVTGNKQNNTSWTSCKENEEKKVDCPAVVDFYQIFLSLSVSFSFSFSFSFSLSLSVCLSVCLSLFLSLSVSLSFLHTKAKTFCNQDLFFSLLFPLPLCRLPLPQGERILGSLSLFSPSPLGIPWHLRRKRESLHAYVGIHTLSNKHLSAPKCLESSRHFYSSCTEDASWVCVRVHM